MRGSPNGRDAAVALVAETLNLQSPKHGYSMVPDSDGMVNVHSQLEETFQSFTKVGKDMTDDAQNVARLAIAEDVAAAKIEFFGHELEFVNDDKDATLVMVLPRSKLAGDADDDLEAGCFGKSGDSDDEEMVTDPYDKAQLIFVRQHNHASAETMKDGFESFFYNNGTKQKGAVPKSHYQKVVRGKLLKLFRESGLKVITFLSVDKDEVFVKLSLDRQGEVIKQLAQRFSYVMPFTKEAYKNVEPHGIFKGGEPMTGDAGKPVVAYGPYQTEIAHHMGGFLTIDEMRIIEMQLHSLISIEQLKAQGILTKYFAVAQHEDTTRLHEDWLELKPVKRCLKKGPFSGCASVCAWIAKVFEVPSYGTKDGLVRKHFGEEVAFFFRWFAFYTRLLGVLGAVGCFFFVVQHVHNETRQVLHVVFSIVMVMWATVFNQLFKNRMAQARQEWGMKDYEAASLCSFDRADYKPELEGSWTLTIRRIGTYVACVMFCVTFIGIISYIEARKREQSESGGFGFFRAHGSVIVVMMIKFWSLLWGSVAKQLADWQNHRTQARYEDALTSMLALVKIFVTLWNFIYVAFIKRYSSPTCAGDLEEVASIIWANDGWATANTTLKAEALSELSARHYSYTANQHVCARGCYPATPEFSVPGGDTNCYEMLRYELVAFFFVHVIYTMIFLLLPIIMVSFAMVREIRKAKQEENGKQSKKASYTWLQYQAKCQPYEYLSWGGSRIEDFLECAIGYALITCFGILFPLLSLFAFLANMVEFRLLAYRMTHVTLRPMPRGASGIGTWQSVFECISSIAVVANVLLIAFVMAPMRSYSLNQQFGIFIVLEHVLLSIRGFIDNVIPEEPHDVRLIDDFNAHFRKTMVKYPPLKVPARESYAKEYAEVDISWRESEGLTLLPSERDDCEFDGEESSSDCLFTSQSDNESTNNEGDRSPWSCCNRPPSFRPL